MLRLRSGCLSHLFTRCCEDAGGRIDEMAKAATPWIESGHSGSTSKRDTVMPRAQRRLPGGAAAKHRLATGLRWKDLPQPATARNAPRSADPGGIRHLCLQPREQNWY